MDTIRQNQQEQERVSALGRYEILDTQPEATYDQFAKLASILCNTPISLISLVDSERQWFKSCIGIQIDEAARDLSFCTHTIKSPSAYMEVKDTLEDDRFKHNPFVVSPPNLRFYAGIAITTVDGFNIGTLCVMDYQPRELSDAQKTSLLEIGKSIGFILEERLSRSESEKSVRKVVQSHTHKINNTLAIALARLDVSTQLEKSSKVATSNAIKRASAQIMDISNQFKLPFHLIDTESPSNGASAEPQFIPREIDSRHQTIPPKLRIQPDETSFNSNKFKPSLVIVEDDVELGKILEKMLSKIFTVTLLHEGEIARQKLNELQPDVALLDWMLPEVHGIELCRHIKRQKNLTFTKVVLLTAKQDDESKLLALNSGADDFLSKPISSLEIKTRLSNLAARVKLEKEIKNQNLRLSEALDELKALETQLIHGAKLSAIGGLASGLLHEVNNPLNYVMTALQLLRREATVINDPELSELTTDIQDGMERIRLIVKDLHSFAYPSDHTKEDSFRLSNAISSALRFTSHLSKDVPIKNLINNDYWVVGSQSHIIQVLINLITNSLAALTEKNDGIIEISAQPEATPQGEEKLIVQIWDNGSGVEPVALEKVFDPFYTTKEIGVGLGMGLGICSTIIQNHGGTLKIASVVDDFTSCTFDLALAPYNKPN